MNKIEVQEMIDKRVKITHRTFGDQEWIKKHATSDAHYIDQDDNVIRITQFWRWRTSPKWNKNWSVCKLQ